MEIKRTITNLITKWTKRIDWEKTVKVNFMKAYKDNKQSIKINLSKKFAQKVLRIKFNRKR